METLLLSLETVVTREGDRITVRSRPGFFVAATAGAALLGGGLQLFPDAVNHMLGLALLLLSPLLALAGLWNLRNRRVVVDGAQQTVTIGGRTYPLSQVSEIRTQVLHLGSHQAVSILATVEGRSRYLVTGQTVEHRATLETLAGDLRDMIGQHGQPPPRRRADRAASEVNSRVFYGTFLLLVGLGWCGLLLWQAPDWRFDMPGRPLVWPLGFWLAFPGVLQLAGLRLFPWLLSPKPAPTLTGLAWFLTYFLFMANR